jgi:hypothetical protein
MNEDSLALYYLNKSKIKQLEEENEDILNELGLRQAAVGTYVEGKFVVEVTENRRFDSSIATKLYPLGENGENMELYSASVDSALAKKHLDPEAYAACQKIYSNNKVEIKVRG